MFLICEHLPEVLCTVLMLWRGCSIKLFHVWKEKPPNPTSIPKLESQH